MIRQYLARRRQRIAAKRLQATLRPDPEYRIKRLAQFDRKRRARFLHNIALTR